MNDHRLDTRRRLLVALALERGRAPHAPEGPLRRVLEGDAPLGVPGEPRRRTPGAAALPSPASDAA